ncbi:DUF5709 domain-containing protein [Streptomyces sp. NPDC058372]|uniref:DUF5709 domain-containing protein n=1 Tax=Streptomyces sp. NPDC058372 TaxID=3346464 RepID=UPI00364773CE
MSDSEDFDAFGDDVYQPQGQDDTDDTDIFDEEDTLMDTGVDNPLDEGYSPPEKPRAVEHTGTTANEEREGESLDERLTEEIPDVQVPRGDGIGDALDTDGEPLDDEVGDFRAGRLVAPDEGAHEDAEKDIIAEDVGIDGAAASAEEAAVHIVEEDADDV